MLFMGISLSSMKLHKLNTRMGTETDEDGNVVIVMYVTNMMAIKKKMVLKVMLFMFTQPFSMKFPVLNTRMGTETNNNVILSVGQT